MGGVVSFSREHSELSRDGQNSPTVSSRGTARRRPRICPRRNRSAPRREPPVHYDLIDGRGHVYEAEMKERRRNPSHPDHTSRPDTCLEPGRWGVSVQLMMLRTTPAAWVVMSVAASSGAAITLATMFPGGVSGAKGCGRVGAEARRRRVAHRDRRVRSW